MSHALNKEGSYQYTETDLITITMDLDCHLRRIDGFKVELGMGNEGVESNTDMTIPKKIHEFFMKQRENKASSSSPTNGVVCSLVPPQEASKPVNLTEKTPSDPADKLPEKPQQRIIPTIKSDGYPPVKVCMDPSLQMYKDLTNQTCEELSIQNASSIPQQGTISPVDWVTPDPVVIVKPFPPVNLTSPITSPKRGNMEREPNGSVVTRSKLRKMIQYSKSVVPGYDRFKPDTGREKTGNLLQKQNYSAPTHCPAVTDLKLTETNLISKPVETRRAPSYASFNANSKPKKTAIVEPHATTHQDKTPDEHNIQTAKQSARQEAAAASGLEQFKADAFNTLSELLKANIGLTVAAALLIACKNNEMRIRSVEKPNILVKDDKMKIREMIKNAFKRQSGRKGNPQEAETTVPQPSTSTHQDTAKRSVKRSVNVFKEGTASDLEQLDLHMLDMVEELLLVMAKKLLKTKKKKIRTFRKANWVVEDIQPKKVNGKERIEKKIKRKSQKKKVVDLPSGDLPSSDGRVTRHP